jgi:hypothetical protein
MNMSRCGFAALLIVSVGLAGCGSGHADGSGGRTCTYNGKTYPYDATWPSTDGCHECWCNGSPDAVCDTGPPCDAGVYGVQACTYAGTSYVLGDIFSSTDGCNTCECLWRWAYNSVACTLKDCSGSPVVDALPASNVTADSCVYNGTTFPLDVYFSAVDGCRACHCRVDGQVTCTLECLGDTRP